MDAFSLVSSAAHDGSFGKNGLPEPSLASLRAGNYRKGRVTLHGLRIAIETPQGERRTGKANGEPWSVICQAHYGYIEGTRGADGDELDVYVGPWPESQMAYVVNRAKDDDSGFDEHKLLLGFTDADSAITAYRNSYERGRAGDASVIPCSIDQLKWWIEFGNHAVPLTANQLPYDGTATMNEVLWDSTANPVGVSIPELLYAMRRNDSGDGLLLDSVTVADVLEASDGEAVLDALVLPLNRLERKLGQMQVIMRAAGKEVKPVAMQITPPFKQRGTTNVACIFEMSDGQTVSIFFHNPDATPNRLTPDDEMVSWKWMLNKKDVTIVVARERGQELNPREVARRVMRLVDANSARFKAANARRAERMQAIETAKAGIETKQAQLDELNAEIDRLEPLVEAKRNAPSDGRITAETAANLKSGDIVRTADGQEFRAFAARHYWLSAHPIVDGKAQISSDTEVIFHLNPANASSYPNRDHRPIYATGKSTSTPPATLQKDDHGSDEPVPAEGTDSSGTAESAIQVFRRLEKVAEAFGAGKPQFYGVIQSDGEDLPDGFMPETDNKQMAMAMGQIAKEHGYAFTFQINVNREGAPFRCIAVMYEDGRGIGSRFAATPAEAFAMLPAMTALPAPASRENAIRTEFGKEGRTLGQHYPLVVLGKPMIVWQERAGANAGPGVLYIYNLKRGKMVSGLDETVIFEKYRLTGKDELKVEGLPREALGDEIAEWITAFPDQINVLGVSRTDPNISRWLPGSDETSADPLDDARAYLQSVIDGTIDLSAPDVADKLTDLYNAHNGNTEFDDLFAKAADAYQEHMVALAQKALQ